MQCNSSTPFHSGANIVDQRAYILGSSTLIDLDEVGMFHRDRRSSHAVTLEPAFVDEPASRLARWIGEYRATIGPTRLMLASPPHDLGQHVFPCLAGPRNQTELGAHHHINRSHHRRSISKGQRGRLYGANLAGRRIHGDHVDAQKCRGHVGTVTAGIHANGPTHGSGDANRPLQSAQ